MTEMHRYNVPGDVVTIGHGDAVHQVREHVVELPDEPWVTELEKCGVIQHVEVSAPESAVEVPQALVDAGFATTESISAASDAELLAVSGVGKATVARLRGALG